MGKSFNLPNHAFRDRESPNCHDDVSGSSQTSAAEMFFLPHPKIKLQVYGLPAWLSWAAFRFLDMDGLFLFCLSPPRHPPLPPPTHLECFVEYPSSSWRKPLFGVSWAGLQSKRNGQAFQVSVLSSVQIELPPCKTRTAMAYCPSSLLGVWRTQPITAPADDHDHWPGSLASRSERLRKCSGVSIPFQTTPAVGRFSASSMSPLCQGRKRLHPVLQMPCMHLCHCGLFFSFLKVSWGFPGISEPGQEPAA